MAVNKAGFKKKIIESFSKKETPKVEAPKEVKVEKVVDGPLCDCGSPIAEGQNSVCKDHIRIN
jgi:hypothetical protein